MIRIGVGIIILVITTIWLPVWVQFIGYVIFCIVTAYPTALFFVAVLADRMYAPSHSIALSNHWHLLCVVCIYAIFQLAMRFTRLKHLYEVEK